MKDDIGTERCIICEAQRPEGITICSEFICIDWEAEILRTDVKDEKYPFFIHQMRRILTHRIV